MQQAPSTATMQPSPLPTPGPASLQVDTHVHLFLPQQFPYDPARHYTPPPATVPELQATLARLGMGRVVLVQPSCYGTDNRALLAGLAELGQGRARGVAVVDVEAVADAELHHLQAAGVRGVRFNLSLQAGVAQAELALLQRRLAAADQRLAPLGWHLQINADAATLQLLAPLLEALRLPVVLDHFAGGLAAADAVVRLLGTGRVWVKLSAPYRVSRAPGYGDLDALVARFAQANAGRLVWGSDWPHTGGTGVRQAVATDIEPFRDEDALATLKHLSRWVPDPAVRERILAQNPAELYGF